MAKVYRKKGRYIAEPEAIIWNLNSRITIVLGWISDDTYVFQHRKIMC
jgi:hypothetical protein